MQVFCFGVLELWGLLLVCAAQLFQSLFVHVSNETLHVGRKEGVAIHVCPV